MNVYERFNKIIKQFGLFSTVACIQNGDLVLREDRLDKTSYQWEEPSHSRCGMTEELETEA